MSLDNDIIHPRNQGVGVDAEFIERWADRKAARAVLTAPSVPKRQRGRMYDPDFRNRFKRLYLSGMTYRQMCVELEASRNSLDLYREAMDLPRRGQRRSANPKPLWVRVSKAEHEAIRLACIGRYSSAAHFIRAAVKEKLDGR
jgi:hypothetical protein